MMRIARCMLLSVAALVGVAPALAEGGESPWTGPVLVSPGGSGQEGRALTGCPTFSWAPQWSLAQAVESYELTVYAIGAPRQASPALRVTLPAGATAWTPEAGNCLPPGRFGWAVGARVGKDGLGETRWSKPAIFRVEGAVRQSDRNRPVPSTTAIATLPAPASPPAPNGVEPGKVEGKALFSPGGCNVGQEKFADVPASDPFCEWIEQLARDGISNGCGGGKFCPDEPVTRRQMALIVERAVRGTLSWAPAPNGPRSHDIDDPIGNVSNPGDMAIGADGFPIISYAAGAANVLRVAHCKNVDCTALDVRIIENIADVLGSFTSIAVGSDGLPIISYTDDTAHTLKAAHCGDVGCTSTTISTVDPGPNQVGLYNSIAIGSDNLPIISYFDDTDDTLKVAHCNDFACSGGNETLTTVDDPVDGHAVGFASSIAIGADGLPVIVYHDGTATTLKVAHCNDQACVGNNETITLIADGGHDIGFLNSIAISGGLPLIAYHDSTTNSLDVLRCNDVACTGSGEVTFAVDDPVEEVGQSSSIAVGVDGLPVISYGDFTSETIKLVHCATSDCISFANQVTVVVDPAGRPDSKSSIEIGIDGAPVISYSDIDTKTLKILHCGTATCHT